MSLQEAKQFVAHFVTGAYTPEEHADFLQWLNGATADELQTIAVEHEGAYDRWVIPSDGPSQEWAAQLERKLESATAEAEEQELENGEAMLEVPVIDIRPA